MTITFWLLGREVFSISTDPPADEAGLDCTTYPVGFAPREPMLTDGRYGFEDPQ